MNSQVKETEKVLGCRSERNILVRVDEVFIHRSGKPTSIRGCLLLVELKGEMYLIWIPYTLLVRIDHHLCVYLKTNQVLVTESEFLPHPQPTTIVQNKEENEASSDGGVIDIDIDNGQLYDENEKVNDGTENDSFTLFFHISSINSIKRFVPDGEHEYLVITLTNTISQSPLYFHDGGMSYFFSEIEKYLTITKTDFDPNLYMICHKSNSMRSSFEKIGFNDYFDDVYQKKWTLFEIGSQITKTVKDKFIKGNKSKGNKDISLSNDEQFPSSSSSSLNHPKGQIIPPRKMNIQEMNLNQKHNKNNNKNKKTQNKKENLVPVLKTKPSKLREEEEKKEEREILEKAICSHSFEEEINTPGMNEIDDFVLIETPETRNKNKQRIKEEEHQIRKEVNEKWDHCHHQEKKEISLDSPEVFKSQFMNENGQIIHLKTLLDLIFYKGISNMETRREIWPFLCGYYSWDSTFEERQKKRKEKREEYEVYKGQWTTITPEQKKNFSSFRSRESRVDKDVVRTDRQYEDYKDIDSPWLRILNDMLITHCFYNFDLGYCQGMNDILAPILSIMKDESEAFWCFVSLMKKIGRNFMKETEKNGIQEQLDFLSKVIQTLDPKLHSYFESVGACPDLFFCFRWLLVMFKREFSFMDVIRLWEAVMTEILEFPDSKQKENKTKEEEKNGFDSVIFISYGILHSEIKDQVIAEKMDNDEIFRFVLDKQMTFDVEKSLKNAHIAFLQYKKETDGRTKIKSLF